jgi:hypothetical protein
MKIEFEGRTWSYDDDLITVDQAEVIEAAPGGWQWTQRDADGNEVRQVSGRSVWDWRQAVTEGSARAFRYLYWIMAAQNGDPLPLEDVSFAFGPFLAAFLAGWRAEVDARLAEQEREQERVGPTQAAATSPPPGPPQDAKRAAGSRRRSPGS